MNPVIAMLIGVVVMMVLVICTRMHAFPSLIISAILIAVLSGCCFSRKMKKFCI